MREAIREALLGAELELVHCAATLESLGARRNGCNAIFYIEPPEGDTHADKDIEIDGIHV